MGCLCGDMNAADEGIVNQMLFYSDTQYSFACIYNTGFGFGNYYCTNGSSEVQQKLFWDYLLDIENNSGCFSDWTLGKAQEWARDKMAPTINWNGIKWRHTIIDCHLFGDPAQTLKPPIINDNLRVESLDVCDHIKSDEMVYVNAVIGNTGDTAQTDVIVNFKVDDELISSQIATYFEGCTSQEVSFQWIPQTSGTYTVTINVTISDPSSTEYYYYDNEKNKDVLVGVLNYNTGDLLDTIQDAIDDSEDGHVIIVPSGIYYENALVNKDVNLIGHDMRDTIVDGSFSGAVFHITDTNFARISGFTIKNGIYGIKIDSASNAKIINNNIMDNDCGILFDHGTQDNYVYSNNFINNILQAIDNDNTYWDGSYPSITNPGGGNYWSDYMELHPDAEELFDLGIWDEPYIIYGDYWGTNPNRDSYPLMEPWTGYHEIVFVGDNHQGPWFGTPEFPYRNIQGGLDNTNDGDTIVVFNGVYDERVIVDKAVNLIGEARDQNILIGSVEITNDDVCFVAFTVMDNEFSGSKTVKVDHSSNCTISNCSISTQGTAEGICLSDSSENLVENCDIYSNNRGICFVNSDNNVIRGNNFYNNLFGIFLDSDCSGNLFYHNNFNNTSPNAQVLDAGNNHWNASTEGNYWIDYIGIDEDGDGIGDIFYDIISNTQDTYPLMIPYLPWSSLIDTRDVFELLQQNYISPNASAVIYYITDFFSSENHHAVDYYCLVKSLISLEFGVANDLADSVDPDLLVEYRETVRIFYKSCLLGDVAEDVTWEQINDVVEGQLGVCNGTVLLLS